MNTTERWRQLVRETLESGQPITSRGFECLERVGIPFSVDMQSPIVLSRGRKLGYRFMCAEAAWILSNDNRVETITPFSKRIASFSDDGVTFFGAYGPRIFSQLAYVKDTLIKDRGSRQAVLTIWRESPPQSRDIPCSISVQWLIRGGELTCLLNMRSSDIWLGVPYDIFNFSMLSLYLLKKLQLPDVALGSLILYAGSSHLYVSNISAVRELLDGRVDDLSVSPFDLTQLQRCSATELPKMLWSFAKMERSS